MNIKMQMLSYSSINILNAAVPFIFLPILTAYLTPSDYGLLSLIQLVMTISLPIVLMNTHSIVIIEYSKMNFDDFKSLLSIIVLISFVGFIILEVLFFIFQNQLVIYSHIPLKYVYMIPLFVLFQSIPTLIPIIYQAKKELFNFAKYRIGLTIINILFSLLFVIVFSLGWEGRLYGIVGSFSIFSFIGLFILFKQNLLTFRLNINILIQVLRFGIPLIPHSIGGVILLMSDRLFLVNILGVDSVGVYSVAFQIASVITIILSSINQAWAPNLYAKLNTNPSIEEKRKIVITTYKIMFLMILITMFFLLSSSYLFDVFIDKQYYEGKTLTKIIAIAFLFQGFYFMITNYIFYTKKTYILSYITFFSVLLISLSNYMLINKYGVIGSAYSIVLVWFIFFISTWIISNRIYPMPWKLI